MPTKAAPRRKRIVRKLRSKFRLVVLNDQTFEERFSLRLSPLNVLVFGGTLVLSLITITLYIIAFTPLREYIPGYADVNMRRNVVRMWQRTDSLDYKISANDRYLANIVNLMTDRVDTTGPERVQSKTVLYDTIKELRRSAEDQKLRNEIESGDRFEISASPGKPSTGIGSYSFYTPVKGQIRSKYDPLRKHYGVDIVAGPDEVIKATLDGTVILADFTSETGYVIGIQHNNNLFSLYKYNSVLLKSAGDYIKAGEVIAVIGNTGEAVSGPHLHFELWYNGAPVNPQDYINF